MFNNHRERVKCNFEYQALFRDLFPQQAHSTFFLCACVGYSRRILTPFEKSYDSFWSDTMTRDEFGCYVLMALEKNNMEPILLGDDKAKTIIELVQEYANTGMSILIEEVISDAVEKNSHGYYELDKSKDIILPKIILCWLSEAIDQTDEPIEVEVLPQP